jgi:hypothetical protein
MALRADDPYAPPVDFQFVSFRHENLREARWLTWAISRRLFIRRWKCAPITAILLPASIWLDAGLLGGQSWGVAILLIVYGATSFLWAYLGPVCAVDLAARRYLAIRSSTTVTITDEHLVFDSPGTSIARHWSVVAWAEERPGMIVLWGDGRSAIGLVCAHCAGPGNFAELRMFLTERGLFGQRARSKSKVSV